MSRVAHLLTVTGVALAGALAAATRFVANPDQKVN